MRKIQNLLAGVLLLAGGAALAAGQQMQPYTSTDGRFTVSFPGNASVTATSESLPFKDGTSGTLYEFSVELDSGFVAYLVMYNDYRADQANEDPQTVLGNTRDGAVKGKTLLSDIAIGLNGVPGREFTCKDDELFGDGLCPYGISLG